MLYYYYYYYLSTIPAISGWNARLWISEKGGYGIREINTVIKITSQSADKHAMLNI